MIDHRNSSPHSLFHNCKNDLSVRQLHGFIRCRVYRPPYPDFTQFWRPGYIPARYFPTCPFPRSFWSFPHSYKCLFPVAFYSPLQAMQQDPTPGNPFGGHCYCPWECRRKVLSLPGPVIRNPREAPQIGFVPRVMVVEVGFPSTFLGCLGENCRITFACINAAVPLTTYRPCWPRDRQSFPD